MCIIDVWLRIIAHEITLVRLLRSAFITMLLNKRRQNIECWQENVSVGDAVTTKLHFWRTVKYTILSKSSLSTFRLPANVLQTITTCYIRQHHKLSMWWPNQTKPAWLFLLCLRLTNTSKDILASIIFAYSLLLNVCTNVLSKSKMIFNSVINAKFPTWIQLRGGKNVTRSRRILLLVCF